MREAVLTEIASRWGNGTVQQLLEAERGLSGAVSAASSQHVEAAAMSGTPTSAHTMGLPTSSGSPHATDPPQHLPVSSALRASPAGTDWLGWGMAGTGVVAMAGAGALFLSSSHLSDEANVELGARRRDQLHDQSRTRSTAGVVVGLGGIGLVTAGIIKLLLHSGETSPRTTTLDIAVTGNGAFVVGRF